MHQQFHLKGEARADGLIIRWQLEDDVFTAALIGALRAGRATLAFEQLVDMVAQLSGALLLDLADLDQVDSRGLGSLVMASTKLGDRIRLLRLSDRVRPLMALCKILTVLPVVADAETVMSEIRRCVPRRSLSRHAA